MNKKFLKLIYLVSMLTFLGNCWSDEEAIETQAYSMRKPEVVYNNADSALSVWLGDENADDKYDSYQRIYANFLTGSDWGTEQEILHTSKNVYSLAFDYNELGNSAVVYSISENGTYNTYGLFYSDATAKSSKKSKTSNVSNDTQKTWSGTQLVMAGCSTPLIKLNSINQGILVCRTAVGLEAINFTIGSWGTKKTVNTGSSYNYLSTDIDNVGNSVVSWTTEVFYNSDPKLGNVFASYYKASTSSWSSSIKMDDLAIQSQKTGLSSGKPFVKTTSDGFYTVWLENEISGYGIYVITPTAVRSKKYYVSTGLLSNSISITEEKIYGLSFASNSNSKGIVAWYEVDAENNLRIYESRQTDDSNLNWSQKTLIDEHMFDAANYAAMYITGLKIALNNSNEAIVVYGKEINYDGNNIMYSLLANQYTLNEDSGEMEWASSPSTLNENEFIEANFSIDLNESHGICVFTNFQATDNGLGGYDIYASRYTN